jgi:hypothetical protein
MNETPNIFKTQIYGSSELPTVDVEQSNDQVNAASSNRENLEEMWTRAMHWGRFLYIVQ